MSVVLELSVVYRRVVLGASLTTFTEVVGSCFSWCTSISLKSIS